MGRRNRLELRLDPAAQRVEVSEIALDPSRRIGLHPGAAVRHGLTIRQGAPDLRTTLVTRPIAGVLKRGLTSKNPRPQPTWTDERTVDYLTLNSFSPGGHSTSYVSSPACRKAARTLDHSGRLARISLAFANASNGLSVSMNRFISPDPKSCPSTRPNSPNLASSTSAMSMSASKSAWLEPGHCRTRIIR